MQFRLRVYGPGQRLDFILPEGAFWIGHNPKNRPRLVIQASYVPEEHARLTTTATGCSITVNAGQGSTHDTRLNNRPLPENQAVPLAAGDRLTIRAPDTQTQVVTILLEQVETEAAPILLASATPVYPYAGAVPPGLKCYSLRLLQFLPEIYQPITAITPCDNCNGEARCEAEFDTFLSRFLAIFESVLLPVEWTITGFDHFLDPRTAPKVFLPWLAQWFGLDADWVQSWDEQQQRAILAGYVWRGTKRGLRRMLEVYTGCTPSIQDEIPETPQQIQITLPLNTEALKKRGIDEAALKKLIAANIPAHTTYLLDFQQSATPTP